MNGPGTGTGGTGTGRTGDGPDLDGTASVRPVEDRLQRAFAARAESIGIRDLRPAAPPGPGLRRGRLRAPRQPWLRRFGLPLAAAAAAAAVALGYLVTAPDGPPDRPLPARPPHSVDPSPAPTPARPTSPASPSATQPDRHRTADPSRSPVPGTDGARPPWTTDTPTAQPSNRPDNSPSGATSPPSTPPSATPTLQDSDKSNKSNTPTAPAS
ncbi:hypothetical protein [Streptomyces tubercidicus]|uniref:Uncharacterized protein n=1 Tax=Streptomyces tubercidicus TaxID=47759 RepID=A0A640USH7_9ACTN|nr:hypothetical protein [Streptomyces tubercidicus]WAU12872.1 hypothetical protein STRTU_003283 [Streptomyces tubercidicus]GFE38384.1 hypothetical protein Stube_30570 [Streptomyces tubercidicus]